MKTTINLFIIIIAVILLSSSPSYSQFGLRGGLNFSSNTVSLSGITVKSDRKIGPQLGFYYEKELNSDLTLRPGLLLSFKGYKEVTDDNSSEEPGSASFTYLEIPIDLVHRIPVSTNALALHGGPYIGYLLSANYNESGGDDIDASDDLKSIDMGLNIGATFEFNSNVGVGINFGFGLVDINDAPLEDFIFIDTEINLKSRNLSLFVTYKL